MRKVRLATVERVCRELRKAAPLRGVDEDERRWNRGYRQALEDVIREVRVEEACGR